MLVCAASKCGFPPGTFTEEPRHGAPAEAVLRNDTISIKAGVTRSAFEPRCSSTRGDMDPLERRTSEPRIDCGAWWGKGQGLIDSARWVTRCGRRTNTSTGRPAGRCHPDGSAESLRAESQLRSVARDDVALERRPVRLGGSRPLLRPLRIPDHRDPDRGQGIAPLLPQLLHAPRASHLSLVLRRPRLGFSPPPTTARVRLVELRD